MQVLVCVHCVAVSRVVGGLVGELHGMERNWPSLSLAPIYLDGLHQTTSRRRRRRRRRRRKNQTVDVVAPEVSTDVVIGILAQCIRLLHTTEIRCCHDFVAALHPDRRLPCRLHHRHSQTRAVSCCCSMLLLLLVVIDRQVGALLLRQVTG